MARRPARAACLGEHLLPPEPPRYPLRGPGLSVARGPAAAQDRTHHWAQGQNDGDDFPDGGGTTRPRLTTPLAFVQAWSPTGKRAPRPLSSPRPKGARSTPNFPQEQVNRLRRLSAVGLPGELYAEPRWRTKNKRTSSP